MQWSFGSVRTRLSSISRMRIHPSTWQRPKGLRCFSASHRWQRSPSRSSYVLGAHRGGTEKAHAGGIRGARGASGITPCGTMRLSWQAGGQTRRSLQRKAATGARGSLPTGGGEHPGWMDSIVASEGHPPHARHHLSERWRRQLLRRGDPTARGGGRIEVEDPHGMVDEDGAVTTGGKAGRTGSASSAGRRGISGGIALTPHCRAMEGAKAAGPRSSSQLLPTL